jgi:hypothetical protein
MGSMAARAAAVAAALVLVGLAATGTAQMESCNEQLPPVLVGNYSGLACQPVWNNFVLRVCAWTSSTSMHLGLFSCLTALFCISFGM